MKVNKHIILFCLSVLFTLTSASAKDAVFETMKSELERNFLIYKQQPIPAYYVHIRLDEVQSIECSARLGRLQSPAIVNRPSHILSSCMRVGDRMLDNSHEIRESGYGSYRNFSMAGQYVSTDNNPLLIRKGIWSQLDELYKQSISVYEAIKANMAVKVEQEDKSPDFSEEKVVNYYEEPIAWESLKIDPKVWEDKVRHYSSIFDENKDLVDGTAVLMASSSRKLFIDTEGREMAENEVHFNLMLAAETLAEDGMNLPLYKTWLAYSIDELPSDEEVIKAAREISQMLSDLRKAPVVESFTGPAILSPEAAGVFFHEIFGHRIEGTRLKEENDAQTFKKKVGQLVLPDHFSVVFDPTMQYFQKTPLGGYYKFDDEGIMGQRVEVVKDGILKNFLMARTPIEGFLHSNGHGRAQIGSTPISRQSNMLISSTHEYSDDELFNQLRKETRAQGKEYAYYFKEVAGGFTNTSRISPNVFNVSPLVVYRVYADGRPSELVRGVDMVGTPLAMFSQIESCGKQYAVFNGICGAESGQIPVSCVAPAMLVKHIETQKRGKSQMQQPVLPKPVADTSKGKFNDLILDAIRKEADRSLAGLRIEGLQPPFYISYSMSDINLTQVVASSGSLLSSAMSPSRGGGSRLLIGDYQCTDENFLGSAGGASTFDGRPCLDDDELGIRYTVWRDLDAIYKRAAETYEQKIATIKQLNLPQEELDLPDWDKVPVLVETTVDQNAFGKNWTQEQYEAYAAEASAVFNNYTDILNSSVSLYSYQAMEYYYNTEGSAYKKPITFIALNMNAYVQTDEGENISSSDDLTYSSTEELPSIEEIKQKCRDFADKLIELKKAPKVAESYSGPILFEKMAVVGTFYSNFFSGESSLIARRKPLTTQGISYGGNGMEDMMDKRVTAREISIVDMTGTPEYYGTKLLGYTSFDAEAVRTPQTLTLVENGILKNLLNNRVPTHKVPHSTGHSLFGAGGGSSTNTGVVRMTDTRQKTNAALRTELLEAAKAEGYEYAYIVRESSGGGTYPTELYQVNVNDGKETRVRSARISNLNSQSFRNNILGVSDTEYIYNGNVGNLISIIVPEAILLDDMQLQSDRIDNYKMPPLVKRTW